MRVHLSIPLPWTAPLLLALGTWLVYVTDRILDGLRAPSSQLRERHFFYARHRAGTLIGAGCASLALLWLVFTRMSPAARREDLILALAALIYFCLIHIWAPQSRFGIERWFPKEIIVAVVFASAVTVPAWSRLAGHKTPLVPIVVLFALLCWLNCVAIERWEARTNWDCTSRLPQPHTSTRWAWRRLGQVACTIALLATIGSGWLVLAREPCAMTALYLACTISALLLLALERSRLRVLDLRIAADLSLLTPLLFIAALR